MNRQAYNHYWEKGWVVVEGVFSAEEADRIAQLALEVSRQEMSDQGDNYVVDSSGTGEVRPAKSCIPIASMPRFKRLSWTTG